MTAMPDSPDCLTEINEVIHDELCKAFVNATECPKDKPLEKQFLRGWWFGILAVRSAINDKVS